MLIEKSERLNKTRQGPFIRRTNVIFWYPPFAIPAPICQSFASMFPYFHNECHLFFLVLRASQIIGSMNALPFSIRINSMQKYGQDRNGKWISTFEQFGSSKKLIQSPFATNWRPSHSHHDRLVDMVSLFPITPDITHTNTVFFLCLKSTYPHDIIV